MLGCPDHHLTISVTTCILKVGPAVPVPLIEIGRERLRPRLALVLLEQKWWTNRVFAVREESAAHPLIVRLELDSEVPVVASFCQWGEGNDNSCHGLAD